MVSSSSPPDSHGVGSTISEMWTQRTALSMPASPGDQPDLEVAQQVTESQHRLLQNVEGHTPIRTSYRPGVRRRNDPNG